MKEKALEATSLPHSTLLVSVHMCACVCMRVCACVCGVYECLCGCVHVLCAYMYIQVSVACLLNCWRTLNFWDGSLLLNPELIDLVGQPVYTREGIRLFSPLPQHWDCRHMLSCLGFTRCKLSSSCCCGN